MVRSVKNNCSYRVSFMDLKKLTFKASPQDAVKNCLSTSGLTGSSFLPNNIMTQSMISVIKYGGLANFRTVEISAAFIV